MPNFLSGSDQLKAGRIVQTVFHKIRAVQEKDADLPPIHLWTLRALVVAVLFLCCAVFLVRVLILVGFRTLDCGRFIHNTLCRVIT